MVIMRIFSGAVVCALSLLFILPVMGQGSSGELLPQDQGSWLNSVPLSTVDLKGKAAFLYFYEET